MFLMREDQRIGVLHSDSFLNTKNFVSRTEDGRSIFCFYQDVAGEAGNYQPCSAVTHVIVIYRHNEIRVIAFGACAPGLSLISSCLS